MPAQKRLEIMLHFTCINGPTLAPWVIGPGETVLCAESGVFAHTDRQGGLSLTLPFFKSMAVSEPADVVEHKVRRNATTVTHSIRFVGGGELDVEFDQDGDLVSFQSQKLLVSTRDGVLTVQAFRR
jgi:hypothetical protein